MQNNENKYEDIGEYYCNTYQKRSRDLIVNLI